MKVRAPTGATAGLIAASLAIAVALLSLSLRAQTRSTATPVQSSSATAPTFYRDVAPILQRHCKTCHRTDGIAPMALQTYGQAKSYSAALATSGKSKTMPPWFAVAGI